MASMTCTPAFLSSPTQRRSAISSFDSSVALYPKPPKSCPSTSVPQLGLRLFSPWNGLRHLGISIRQNSVKIEIKRKGRGKVVYASLFGVGAPEALVIGVVALLVFGPKGLAEVARNLGKTLRAFQPTIRELQVVSREFKSTLEREIGLDDIPNSMQNTYISTPSNATSTSSNTNSKSSQAVVDPNGVPSVERAYSSEDYLKITEEQLKAAAAQQQEQMPSQEEKSEPPPQPQATAPEVATTTPPPQGPKTET